MAQRAPQKPPSQNKPKVVLQELPEKTLKEKNDSNGRCLGTPRHSSDSRKYATCSSEETAWASEAEVQVLDLETDGSVRQRLQPGRSSNEKYELKRESKEFCLLKKSRELREYYRPSDDSTPPDSEENLGKPRRKIRKKIPQHKNDDIVTDTSDQEDIF